MSSCSRISLSALHTGEHVLRYPCEIPASTCERCLTVSFLQLPPLLLEEVCHLRGHVVAEA